MRSIGVAMAVLVLLAGTSSGHAGHSEQDGAEQEIRSRLDAFNQAWQERDMSFIREFYAHDDDMLLFFERRQLRGWSAVETLYENMFAHALPGSVESSYSNLQIQSNGDMGYAAANFHLEVRNPQGEPMTDTGRVSLVFERRDGEWVVVHRHTSFQAPPGPQRKVPLHTEPGPLWSPSLEGAWRTDGGALLLATATYVTTHGIDGLPEAATYRIADEGLWLSEDGQPARLVELTRLTTTELMLRLSGGAHTFRRVE